MAKVLDLPKLSPTMEEGQIAKWHKKEGDAVSVDDLLAEVETDKATMEYRSFDKGTLLKILAPDGAVVRLGEPVAVLGSPGEDISALPGVGAAAPEAAQAKGAGASPAPEAAQDRDAGASSAPEAAQSKGAGASSASKAAQSKVADASSAHKAAQSKGADASSAHKAAQSKGADASSAHKAAQSEDAELSPDAEAAQSEDAEAPAAAREAASEGEEPPPQDQESAAEGEEPPPQDQEATPEGEETAAAEPEAEPAQSSVGPTGRVKASPYVRKLAREQGYDLHAVAGSGPGGRIVARDLSTAAKGAEAKPAEAKSPGAKAPAAKPAQARPAEAKAPDGKAAQARPAATPATAPGALAEPESRPLSMMRKAIARNITLSKQTVPHFYLTIDVDADPLHALREQINGDLAAQGEGAPKVSFNDLIVKACAIALVRVPECNAQFTETALLFHKRVDISVAVSVPDGLLTPVVRDADRKGVLAIAAEMRDLAGRARAKKLRPEEMQNGTFSVSNLGMFGIDAFSAVINPPEGAILAVGQVRREPVVKGDAVVPGRRLAMTLSCDHRVIDGAVGATFLRALRQVLEHPTQILLS